MGEEIVLKKEAVFVFEAEKKEIKTTS